MPKTNIVFFTGENRVFLRRDLDKWIEVFISKYGEYNVSRLDVESCGKINLSAELMTPVFLWEKRLLVLEGFPLKAKDREEWEVWGDVESVLLESLEKVPDSTVILFVESEPDKRKTLYKKLLEIATVKNYPLLEWDELSHYIRRRLPNLDIAAVSRFIEFTAGDINRIESEIEKLSLYRQDGWISEDDIRANIIPNIDASAFGLTDALLALDIKKAYEELSRILDTHNIHQAFATVLSTLRTFLYIAQLSSSGYAPEAIKTALKIHPFAFDKMRKRLSSENKISSLFSELVFLDRKAKTGEGIGDTDEALKIGMERAILRLQKK